MLDEIVIEAAAHRVALVALLRSHLPYGQRGQAAKVVGVTPAYFSQFLSDRPYSGWGTSKHRSDARLEPLPVKHVSRLADWLGLDAMSKDQLLKHADLSHESKVKAYTIMEKSLLHRNFEVIFSELLKLHVVANLEPNPSIASNLFIEAYYNAKQLADSIPPREYPLEFAQVCLILNHIEAVLDRNIDGIYHAQLAQHWASIARKKKSSLFDKDAEDLRVNAMFAEAVSLHNLGLDKKACCIFYSVLAERFNIWSCEAALNLLKCTPLAQRTSLRQVDELSENYLEVVEKFGSEINQAATRLSFLEAKLRAYVTCSPTKTSLKKADKELEQFLLGAAQGESEEDCVFMLINQIGVLRSVIFLNTYSQLLKMRGDFIRAKNIRAEAESRANQSRLTHQLDWIRSGRPFSR